MSARGSLSGSVICSHRDDDIADFPATETSLVTSFAAAASEEEDEVREVREVRGARASDDRLRLDRDERDVTPEQEPERDERDEREDMGAVVCCEGNTLSG